MSDIWGPNSKSVSDDAVQRVMELMEPLSEASAQVTAFATRMDSVESIAADVDSRINDIEPAALLASSRVFDVRKYAEDIADLAVDAGPAILAAWADIVSQGGGTLFFGPADYKVGPTGIPMVATVPLTIDLNGQKLRTVRPGPSTTYGWRIDAPVSSTTLVTTAAIARDATTATFASTATIEAGDVIRFNGGNILESGWNSGRWATMLVEKVVGNVVHFTGHFRIPFPTNDCVVTHYKQPPPVVVKDGTFHYDGLPYNMNEPEVLLLTGLNGLKIIDVDVTSDQPYMPGGQNYGCGFRLSSCVGTTLSNIQFEGIHYGAVITTGSLNTYCSNIRATKTRHAITPTGWAVNTVINGITGDLNWQTIEAHPSFGVHYSNVVLTREEGYPNMRCVGGSIANAVIHCDVTDASSRSLMHNVEFIGPHGSLTWYDNEVLTLSNVQIFTPNMNNANAISGKYGHLVLDNVIANVRRDAAERTAFESTLRSVNTTNCRNVDGTPWESRVFANPPRVNSQPVIHAYAAGNPTVYHIDPYLNQVDASNDMMRCYGKIRQGVSAGGTLTFPIRIHTNAWGVPANGYVTAIHGILRLRATVRHGNAGVFDILTKEFHFYHNAAGAGSVAFPTTPAYTDALTGQENESLAMNILNPSQSGKDTSWDTWVQIDVSMASGRTSPLYGLTYDLELIKGIL